MNTASRIGAIALLVAGSLGASGCVYYPARSGVVYGGDPAYGGNVAVDDYDSAPSYYAPAYYGSYGYGPYGYGPGWYGYGWPAVNIGLGFYGGYWGGGHGHYYRGPWRGGYHGGGRGVMAPPRGGVRR